MTAKNRTKPQRRRSSGTPAAVCRYCRHDYAVDDVYADSIYSLRQVTDDLLPAATYADDSDGDGIRSQSQSAARTPSSGHATTDGWTQSSALMSLTSTTTESAVVDVGDDELYCGGRVFGDAECSRCGHHHRHHHHRRHHHQDHPPQQQQHDQLPSQRPNFIKHDTAEQAIRPAIDDYMTSRATAY